MTEQTKPETPKPQQQPRQSPAKPDNGKRPAYLDEKFATELPDGSTLYNYN